MSAASPLVAVDGINCNGVDELRVKVIHGTTAPPGLQPESNVANVTRKRASWQGNHFTNLRTSATLRMLGIRIWSTLEMLSIGTWSTLETLSRSIGTWSTLETLSRSIGIWSTPESERLTLAAIGIWSLLVTEVMVSTIVCSKHGVVDPALR